MPMDVRLVQLLGSFVGARGRYVLARLEFAIRYPAEPAPPLLDRPSEPHEHALREAWPKIEIQLEEAQAYAGRFESGLLQRSLTELDQYARAIRWVLTVTEGASYDS
jgi:hypothetical protein